MNRKPKCLDITNQGNDLGRLVDQPVCKLFVVVDEIVDIDIAVVLLQQSVFLQLISAPVLGIEAYVYRAQE